jgi:FtsZ-interacting cell division protein ZipA
MKCCEPDNFDKNIRRSLIVIGVVVVVALIVIGYSVYKLMT